MLQIDFSRFSIKTERPAFIMGIVNATPDSFFEGSRGGAELAMQLIEQGADIIDVGGESTRPGFEEVSEEEEIKRIIPVIKEIRKKSDVIISVDTRKASVFKAAYEEGANIFNDVSALTYDEKSVQVACALKVPVVLMHNGAGNATDVLHFFKERAQAVERQGVSPQDIIVDPGIGFGKSNEESISIINQTSLLCECSYPLLMALSRKRCIGEMTGKQTSERMAGTLAANMISVQNGAKIVRVHDVAQTFDALNVMKYLQ